MRCYTASIRSITLPLSAATMLAVASLASAASGPPRSRTQPPDAFVTVAPAAAHAALPSRTPAPLAARSLDGAWQEFGQLQISMHAAVYDPAGDRLIAIGGTRYGARSLPLAGVPVWQPLPESPGQQWPAYRYTSTWDPVAGLEYFTTIGAPGTELWSYDPATGAATAIVAAGTAPVLQLASILADPVHHRLVLVGGFSLLWEPSADVWVLDLLPTPTWSQWTVAGTGPGPVFIADMVLDPVRDRLVAVSLAAQGPSPGVFALALDGPPTWTQLSSQSVPWGANQNGVAYDAAGDQVVALGPHGELEAFSLASNQWTPIVAAGPGPAWRSGAALVMDTMRHRLLVSGGQNAAGDDTYNDAWALSLDGSPAWTALVPNVMRPPARGGACDGYDAARNRLVVFGGADQNGGVRNDTWLLTLGPQPAWLPLAPAGTVPPARYFGASAYDTQHDRLVVFGGYGGIWNQPLADLWTLSFAGGTPAWSHVVPPGPSPEGRTLPSLVYDSYRDRFLLLFGSVGNTVLADVWELRLSPSPSWRLLSPTGPAPAARTASMATYDPFADRVIVFDGSTNNDMIDELWALDLAAGDGTWTQWHVPNGPTARNLGLMRMDTRQNRLLLFGGYGVSRQTPGFTWIDYLNDSWALSLAGAPQWNELVPAGAPPGGRDRASGAYDPAGDRFWVTCGGVSGMNDTWALAFAGTPTPTQLALQSQDVTCERAVLVWAGASPGGVVTAYRRMPGDVWRSVATLGADGEGRVRLEDRAIAAGATYDYRLGIAAAQGEAFFGAVTVRVPVPALSLTALPAARGIAFAIQLPDAAAAELALFDLAGRRLWRREVGSLGAGAHRIADLDVTLAPALYFARLAQGGMARGARVVVTR